MIAVDVCAIEERQLDRLRLCKFVAQGDPIADIEVLLGEIDRLSRELAEARAALEPFADYADKRVMPFPDDMYITNGSPLAKRQLMMGDCRAAARALASRNPADGES